VIIAVLNSQANPSLLSGWLGETCVVINLGEFWHGENAEDGISPVTGNAVTFDI